VKRAYLVNGTLAQPATAPENIFALDATTWAYLDGLLGTDYCYLVVQKKEVVKVIGLQTPNIALVERGIDSTQRRTWPVGSTIAYGLTEAEINDAVTYVGLSLTVNQPLQENDGVISYPEMQILGIGGCTVDGSDEGIWMIQDIPDNVGCCSLAGQAPPPIPLIYFNLRIVTEGYFRGTSDGSYRLYI
jgi:hypothetical protein